MISSAGVSSFLHPNRYAGRIEHRIGLMSWSFASSHMDMMLPKMLSRVMSPLFCAISLVPARITTYSGARFRTSFRNLTSMWDVVCPLMPLPTKLLNVKKSASILAQLSVMESPMNTALGVKFTPWFACSYLLNFAQSLGAFCAAAVKPAARTIMIISAFFIPLQRYENISLTLWSAMTL